MPELDPDCLINGGPGTGEVGSSSFLGRDALLQGLLGLADVGSLVTLGAESFPNDESRLGEVELLPDPDSGSEFLLQVGTAGLGVGSCPISVLEFVLHDALRTEFVDTQLCLSLFFRLHCRLEWAEKSVTGIVEG